MPEQAGSEQALSGALGHLADQGYVILPDVLSTDTTAALRADLDRLHQELGTTPSDNDFEGRNTLRVYNLLAHGPQWQAIAVSPATLPIVEGVLDRGCLVSSLSSIDIGAGETAQPIHADDALHPIAKPHAATVCNTMWALTDFTADNGATRIIPGSHLADTGPVYGQHYDSIPAEMSEGSVLVWHGSLWHGGGENRTDLRRVGIAMNYCAGWIRSQENQQLGLATSLVQTFEPRLRDLVGYGVYSGLIGHIERRTPADMFFGDSAPGRSNLWDRLG